MKRTYLLSLCLLVLTMASAQTQQGVVKTKGRMVNGQLQPGTKLSGAVIAVRGRSAVLSQNNGKFSFATNGQSFMLDSVRKKGYQLVDAEAAPRSYAVTKSPLYVLMETPEQQMQDKLTAERKIRLTLQRQLQEKEDNIEPSYDSSEGNIQQLSFSTNWPTRQRIDHAGLLNFAINDISLIESVLKKIEQKPILQDALGLRDSLASLVARGDTIRDIWFNDNVGEVYLNITVLRAHIPSNIPMWEWVVKLYRCMELAFLTNTVSPSLIGTSYYMIGGRQMGGLLFIHILFFVLVVVLILYVDHKVLSHKTGFFSSQPTPPSKPTSSNRSKRHLKTKTKK